MKAVSVLVVLALLILPIWIPVLYIISQLLTKGAGGIESLPKPSPKLERFRAQHKVLFYLLLSSYPLILFAALCWAIYEFTVGFGVFWQLAIAGGSLLFIMMSAYIAWIFARAEQLRKKFPSPAVGSSSKEYLEWQNKILDQSYNHYAGRKLLRNIAIACGIMLLFLGLFVIVAYYLLR